MPKLNISPTLPIKSNLDTTNWPTNRFKTYVTTPFSQNQHFLWHYNALRRVFFIKVTLNTNFL